MRALSAVFEPDQIATLRAVAADAEREAAVNVGRSGKAPPPAEHSSIFTQLLTGEIGGEALGHVVGAAAGLGKELGKLAMKTAKLGASVRVSRMRAAGMSNVDDVLTAAVLNPELARVLLSRPIPASRPVVLQRLRGLLGNLAADGMLQADTRSRYGQ